MRSVSVEHLRERIRRECCLKGTFPLPDGSRAEEYVDLWRLVGSRSGLQAIGTAIRNEYITLLAQANALGGPAMASLPLTCVTVEGLSGDWKLFTVRRKRKGYGTRNLLEGQLSPGDTAVLLEDVASTGASLEHAAAVTQAWGVRVVGAICIVERDGEGARKRLLRRGIELHSLLLLSEVYDDEPYDGSSVTLGRSRLTRLPGEGAGGV